MKEQLEEYKISWILEKIKLALQKSLVSMVFVALREHHVAIAQVWTSSWYLDVDVHAARGCALEIHGEAEKTHVWSEVYTVYPL